MRNNLYKEEILDHFQNPQNFGKLDTFDISAKQVNPFCGDEIELFIKLENNTVENVSNIERISFLGKGCALSIAAASLLTEFAVQKSVQEMRKFSENDMLKLLTIEVSETRKKCVLLALATLKDCFLGT